MIRLLSGDCRDVLPTLAADSVHCVVTSPPYYALRSYLDASHPDKHREIGSEPTPDEYLATMVAVFREVRRVLRSDGTCWVNMGDSYNSNPQGGSSRGGLEDDRISSGVHPLYVPSGRGSGLGKVKTATLKPKDLLLMPARLALALQADGWWVRSDIIWHKPNPMPESCTDRPTSSYEHVFLLTRSARYWYDADAVREEAEYGASIPRDGARRGPFANKAIGGGFINGSRAPGNGGTRSCRNVWTIATAPFSDFHYATFPPALAERCIRAGTSEKGCCPECGAPWYRVSEYGKAVPLTPSDAGRKATWTIGDANRDPSQRTDTPLPRHYRPSMTIGWHPTCACDKPGPVVPCTVLDPFAGAGTTLLVADRLQRDAIGIELNTAYTQMALERCRADAPLFTAFPPAEPPEDARMADLFAEAAE